MKIRLGTRKSALAMWQARHVQERLERLGITVELVPITTTGDRIVDRPLASIGGKGLFLKEIEEALLENHIDAAVHSLKDVPWHLPAGLRLDAYLEREDPRDALVSRNHVGLSSLGPGARVGTTSLRRICQLRARRPDLHIEVLRGNIDTRLRKLGRGDVDAAILALAGLRRLGLENQVAEVFSLEDSVPAVGQGIMAIEVREDDSGLCAALNHPPTQCCARAERATLEALGGDCNVPVAAHARLAEHTLDVTGLVGKPDGSQLLRRSVHGSADDPTALGAELGRQLLAAGAREILKEISPR